jgi:AcrR family transcriptional regulator
VARTAGLSRQTLYRYFPNKETLVAEVVTNETTQLIETVIAAGAVQEDPRDALEAGFLAALVASREHPLLDRLVRTEPEALLPLLTSDAGPVMAQVRGVVEQVLAARMTEIDGVQLRRLADIVTRLLISYAVSAPDDPPEVVAEFVATFLTHGALRLTTTSGGTIR